MIRHTETVIVADVFGNEGETDGSLAVTAITDPSPMYPETGRVFVGSTKSTKFDLGINMSPDKAIELATRLVEMANAAVAACPQSTSVALNYPTLVVSGCSKESAKLLAMTMLVDDFKSETDHRAQRDSGGQHVGKTSNMFTGANVSVMLAFGRLLRDAGIVL